MEIERKETSSSLLTNPFEPTKRRKQKKKTQSEAGDGVSPVLVSLTGGSGAVNYSMQEVAELGAYMKREQVFEDREATGELKFLYLRNDDGLHSLKLLTDVKNVYSRQLPNMPKEYICKLVFNKTHRSIAVLKNGKQVIGSITYKTFTDQSFAEIAFCAVEGLEQVQGIGTRMMNYCKLYARHLDNVRSFLTYADNNAIGYFAKQGFVKRELPQKRRMDGKKSKTNSQNGNKTASDQYAWAGYIKDYDGGTLMECEILAKVPYTKCLAITQKHKESLLSKIVIHSNSHVVYPGMSFPKQRKRRKLNPADIPGVKEAGWTPDQLITNLHFKIDGVWERSNPDTLHLFLRSVLEYIKGLPEAEPFLRPVTVEDAVDYFDIISDPMDLSLMERRLEVEDVYTSVEIFKADMKLMIDNCRLYNRVDTHYYKYAHRLEQAFHRYLNENMMEF